MEPQVWGWSMRNDFLEPIMTILPPAPEDLLNTIFCNCKSGCGSRCGCRKAGLQCSLACGQRNGLVSMLYHIRAALTKMEPLTPKSSKNLRQMSLKTIMKTSLKFTSSRKTTMKRKKMIKIINCRFCTLYYIFLLLIKINVLKDIF